MKQKGSIAQEIRLLDVAGDLLGPKIRKIPHLGHLTNLVLEGYQISIATSRGISGESQVRAAMSLYSSKGRDKCWFLYRVVVVVGRKNPLTTV